MLNLRLTKTKQKTKGIKKMNFPQVAERPLFLSQINKMNSFVDTHKAIMNPETNHVYGILSRKYELTKHEDLLNTVRNAIDKNIEYGKATEYVNFFEDGSKMRATFIFKDIEVEIDRGDKVNPQIEVFNSYDGGWARKILFGAFRLVCSNGLVIGEKQLEYKQKHLQVFSEESVGQLLITSMEKFSERKRVWESWVDRVTTPQEYEKIMTNLNLSQKDQDAIGQEVEISSNIMMDDLRTKTLSYWIFFNLLCQYLTHSIKSHLKRAQIENTMRRNF
jgi:hypothetical protein